MSDMDLRHAVESIIDDVFVRTRSSLEYFADTGLSEGDAWTMAAYYQQEAENIEERIMDEHEDDEVFQDLIYSLHNVHGVDLEIRGKVAQELADMSRPYDREDIDMAVEFGGVPREERDYIVHEVCQTHGIETPR